jgi:hypothetical protein
MADLDPWPALPLAAWEPTLATLHRWTQIVGKLRLAQSPWTNHSWHVPLYVTPRGLTTSPIPYGDRAFEVSFDLVAHRLLIHTSDAEERVLPLRAQSVADFHAELMAELRGLGLDIPIYGRPCEIEDATPFTQDRQHASYDPEYASRLGRLLVQADRVLKRFRASFVGKASPVHFFWGGFDLAVTRFSGRVAPPHPGGVPNVADWVMREAYSHEVSSAGFWPGGGPHPYPLFYSYAYPEPAGFAAAPLAPEGAFYSAEMREFILPYDVVRESASPEEALLAFLESSYAAAADLGGWDRASLERAADPRTR